MNKLAYYIDDEVYPSLIYARRQHACGQFKTNPGSKHPLFLVGGGISEFGESTATVDVIEVLKHEKGMEVRTPDRKRWKYTSLSQTIKKYSEGNVII